MADTSHPFAPRGVERIWFLHFRVRRWGTREGRRSQPPGDETKNYPHLLGKIRQLGERQLSQVARAWSLFDTTPFTRFCELKGDLERLSKQRDELKAQLAAMKPAEVGAVVKRARQAVEKAQQDLVKRSKRLPPPPLKISAWIYWGVLGLLALGELPINITALGYLRGGLLETSLLALFVGVVIVIASHFLAVSLREHGESGVRVTLQIILSVLPLVVIVVAGLIRAGYIEALEEVIGTGREVSQFFAFTLFAGVGLLIFGVSLAFSYFAHHSRPEQSEEDEVAFKQANTALAQAKRVLGEAEELDRTEAAHVQEATLRNAIAGIENSIEATADALALVQARRQKEFDTARAVAEEIRNKIEELMHEYCAANLMARPRGERPPILAGGALPNLEPREELELKTVCEGEARARSPVEA